MQQREEVISYLKTISVILVSFVFLLFPLFFLTNTTDFFIFPKQLLIVFSTLLLGVLWGLRMVLDRRVRLISTPFNLPLSFFGIVVLLSSLLSRNLYDSLLAALPLILLLFFSFFVVNSLEDKNSFTLALSALTLGTVLAAFISILYYFKIYVLPFPAIQNQYFNTFGSQVQHLAYLFPIFLLSSFSLFRKRALSDFGKNSEMILQLISSVIIIVGLLLVLYQIVTLPQKPIFLPYVHGFQIALATISQDAPRLILSFLFGSGYGTFSTDFTRFRLPTFNLERDIWNLTFPFSSSYFLELVATTGILGVLSFLYLLIKVIKTRTNTINPLFIALFVVFGLSFLIPFSYTLVFLLLNLISFYASFLYLEQDKRVYSVSLTLVAFREGLLSVIEDKARKREESPLFPWILLILILLGGGFVGLYGARLLISDTKFFASLQRDALNNGQRSYTLETDAIGNFPYRSDYYRVFSQINFALANSLTNSIPRNSSPSAQTQSTILSLLQQSINSSRTAASLSPLTVANWENLAQVYRNLINVGQNAAQFAIVSEQQAITLDPSNPQLYINLGGIYYQIGQYEAAQNQFQIATNLKRDFTNAYYNLGHAFEAKGDLQNALNQYLIVKNLVQNNKDNLNKISQEIDTLEKQIGKEQKQVPEAKAENLPTGGQPPLEVNSPKTTFPPQKPEVKIPPPPASLSPGEPTSTGSGK